MQSGKQQNYWPGFVDALSNVVLTMVFVMVIFTLALFYFAATLASRQAERMCTEAPPAAVAAAGAQPEVKPNKGEPQEKAPEQAKPAWTEIFSGDSETVAKIEGRLKESRAENSELRAKINQLSEALRKQEKEVANLGGKKESAASLIQGVIQEAPENKAPNGGETPTPVVVSGEGEALVIAFPTGDVTLGEEGLAALNRAMSSVGSSVADLKVEIRSVPGVESYTEGRRMAYYRILAIRNYFIDKGVSADHIASKVVTRDSDNKDSSGKVVVRVVRP